MYYFASDVHLGAGHNNAERRAVERRFVEWLRKAGEDAQGVFLCGDIFDFWYEYKRVVPKGFVRVLAELASLTERGVRVVFMAGNHDMWIGNYLSEECGVELYTTPKVFNLNGVNIHVAHGDNLNVNGDVTLQIINKMFRSNFVRTLFSNLIHPDLALKFGHWWSNESRDKHYKREGHNTIDGMGVRPLVAYAKMQQEARSCRYYIYGHLHQTLQHSETDSRGEKFDVLFINDWSEEPHYVALDKNGVAKICKL